MSPKDILRLLGPQSTCNLTTLAISQPAALALVSIVDGRLLSQP